MASLQWRREQSAVVQEWPGIVLSGCRSPDSGGGVYGQERFVRAGNASVVVREASGKHGPFHGVDVAPDGKRLLALLDTEDAKPETHLRVLLNVDDELRRRTSAGSAK